MSFSAKEVKELREKTGAGMMDCKKALTETGGDMETAVDFLRKKGLAAAAKKQSRIAAEGVIAAFISEDRKTGAVIEVNCETDFVAKGDDFKGFANSLAILIAKNNPTDVEALKSVKTDSGMTVEEQVNELTLKIGEKISPRRFTRYELNGEGTLGQYIHGSKIGVIVELATDKDVNSNDDFSEYVKDITMHIAASDPKFIRDTEIDEEFKNRESEIYTAQLKEQGKPDNIIPNIIKGKLAKLASEVCLLNQKFVKDPDLTVDKLTKEVGTKVGATITVNRFEKFNLGEGIEKKVDNLADEVAKLSGGN